MARSDGFVMSGLFPNSRDAEAVKRNGFHDLGLLVVSVDDDRIGWDERQILKNIGEKLYGKKEVARK